MRIKSFNFTLIIFLLVFNCMNYYGKDLNFKSKIGSDSLMLPRQLLVSDDEIFILDEYGNMTSGDEKIKVFSRNLRFITEFGREGQGPGEFGGVSSFYIFNKKIFILDAGRRMIHIFSKSKKCHLDSKKFIFTESFNTPLDFVAADNGLIYYVTGNFINGEKLIIGLDRDFKIVSTFLDCIAVSKSLKKFYSEFSSNNDDNIRKLHMNKGYITAANNKIYFTYWLLNRVVELSFNGELLETYNLPISSIEKTVKVIRKGMYTSIERRLNYDILSYNKCIYVLSREKNGDSVIFELNDGKFREKYRMKEQLFSCDISDNILYGVERDEGEILIYDLK